MFSTTQKNLPSVIYLLFCFALLMVLPGCRGTVDQDQPGDPCDEFPETYGGLSYLRATSHPELRKEYALLIDQHHTPCQLVKLDNDPRKNVAVALRKALSRSQPEEIIKETYFLTQRQHFEFSPLQLKRVKALADDYKFKNRLVTEAMELPNCLFEYDHTQGLMADDSFIEQVLAACRMQTICAANCLYNMKSDSTTPEKKTATLVDPALKKAIDCIHTIFKLADRLGQVKQIRARLLAASIREEACQILEALVYDPRCNKKTLLQLQEIVQDELAHWNSDAEMWIGDRALGLYIYEVVRDGMILSVISDEEEEAFRQEGTLKYLAKTTQETADEDQVYYLATMRDLIHKCRRDFYKRPLLGPKIAEDLKNRENSLNYPIVAARILLREVDNALLLQMVDLARIRAWSVALAIATGKEPT